MELVVFLRGGYAMHEIEIRVYLLDVTREIDWTLETIMELPFTEFTISNFTPIRTWKSRYKDWQEMIEAIEKEVQEKDRTLIQIVPTLKYEKEGVENYELFIKEKSGYLAFIAGDLVEIPEEKKEDLDNLAVDFAYKLMTEEKTENTEEI